MADVSNKRPGMGRAPGSAPRAQQINHNSNSNSNNSNSNNSNSGNSSSGNSNSPLMSLDATLNRVLGAKIRVKLAGSDTETTGYIINVSPTYHVLALSPTRPGSQPSGQTASNAGITMINVSAIDSFQILELATPEIAEIVIATVPTLTNAEVEKSVRNAMAKALDERANQGKGVSAEAQQLYDALKRILPIRWTDGGAFVLNENTLIEPPYGADNLKPLGGAAERSIAYVRKVFESERKKLVDKQGSKAPPSAEKKGG